MFILTIILLVLVCTFMGYKGYQFYHFHLRWRAFTQDILKLHIKGMSRKMEIDECYKRLGGLLKNKNKALSIAKQTQLKALIDSEYKSSEELWESYESSQTQSFETICNQHIEGGLSYQGLKFKKWNFRFQKKKILECFSNGDISKTKKTETASENPQPKMYQWKSAKRRGPTFS